MAPSSTKHQRLAGKLFNTLNSYIQSNKGTCEPFIAPFAVFLSERTKTMLSRIYVLSVTKASLQIGVVMGRLIGTDENTFNIPVPVGIYEGFSITVE